MGKATSQAASSKTASKPAPAKAAERPAPTLHRAIHRYGSIYQSIAATVVVGALALAFDPGAAFELAALAFFLVYLASIVIRLPRMTQGHLRAHADESDIPGYIIVVVALAALIGASVSLFVLINGGGSIVPLRLALGVLALVLGWLTIHSMLAFHYAYEFYGTDEASPVGKDGRKSHVGGLEFPGKQMPDGLSFMYFSFVVAMTAQVSDVVVTSNAMRRIVLLHGIASFFFNTVILAMAVNIVVSLGH